MRDARDRRRGAGSWRRSLATQEPSYFVLAGRFRFQSTARDRRKTLGSDGVFFDAAIDDSSKVKRCGEESCLTGPGGIEAEGCSVEIHLAVLVAMRQYPGHLSAPGCPPRCASVAPSTYINAFPTIAPSRATPQPPNPSRGRRHGRQGLSHVKPPACLNDRMEAPVIPATALPSRSNRAGPRGHLGPETCPLLQMEG